eukprot:TRINITY_DN11834_c0_g1_i3.p1 TRINITY_DN11834_c0_g1~~TRINITY_DN11834_c0_g1_i3.p1  ORF type:complete len:2324 (+),score=948.09 TRINITY_DN11834_c0_g1_i3:913-6972(+)
MSPQVLIHGHMHKLRQETDVSIAQDQLQRRKHLREIFCNAIESHVGPTSLLMTALEHCLRQQHIMEMSFAQLLTSAFSLLSKGISELQAYFEERVHATISDEIVSAYAMKRLLFSLLWGFGGSLPLTGRNELGDLLIQSSPISPPSNGNLLGYGAAIESGDWHSWSDGITQLQLEPQQVLASDLVIPTVDTVRHVSVLQAWLEQRKPLVLCGPPGSGKSMTLTSTLRALAGVHVVSLNFSSATSPELVMRTLEQNCVYKRTPKGIVMEPAQAGRWLVVFCDEINLPAADKYGTQRVISFLRQLIELNGFWRKSDCSWVQVKRVQFVGACNPPTDPGRVPLSLRFLRSAPVLLVDFPSDEALVQIYSTFNKAVLKLQPNLRGLWEPLTNMMLEVYHANQKHFLSDVHAHYVYSPRELTRWVRAIFSAIGVTNMLTIDEFIRLAVHEGLRLFGDRLASPDEEKWCNDCIDEAVHRHFPQASPDALRRPIMFCQWLSKNYESVSLEELRPHVQARLKVFHEEELTLPLVLYDECLEHILRIDRVLRQPMGHMLLVGESGSGKTLLTRFVSWTNNLSVFQIKASRKYNLENFDEDLRNVLHRCGCEGEKICFIFDESNALSSAFLERMNALLATGEVPGLFEGEELSALLAQLRQSTSRSDVVLDSAEDEELMAWFTREVQQNLHVVFTVNPASGEFGSQAVKSPALFNRCVVDWFGECQVSALAQIGEKFTDRLDLERSDYRIPHHASDIIEVGLSSDRLKEVSSGQPLSHRDAVVSSLVHFHNNVKEILIEMGACVVCPRDFLDLIEQFSQLLNEKRTGLEEEQMHLQNGLAKLHDTEEQVATLRSELTVTERELKQKDEQAKAKLDEILKDQSVAETKRSTAVRMSEELAQRNKEIDARRKSAEEELAEAEPALIKAQKSVSSIKRTHLDEMRSMASPPETVKIVLSAVADILELPSSSWTELRKVLQRRDFISLVVNFKTDNLRPGTRQRMQRRYLSNPNVNHDSVQRASKACGPLYDWIISQVHFSEIIERVQPLRDEVQALQQQSDELSARCDEERKTAEGLESSIVELKSEYAALISETEQLKVQITEVRSKVERSESLLASLSSESSRWEQSRLDFHKEMTTLFGDCLLSAGFLSYSGFFDYRQRKELMRKWTNHLEDVEISFRENLPLLDYLSTSDQRLNWAGHGLPQDDLSIENCIIMQRFLRYPFLIDPSGQSLQFLQKQCESMGRRYHVTSFADEAFIKKTESALRFGAILIIDHVSDLDPILYHVLNRECQRTGGRTLVQLGDQDVDFAQEFALFMICRDSAPRLGPDVCSRVTLVNFTVTPSSLESQCLNQVLQCERPDVQERRTALMRLQGDYHAQLKALEAQLLSELNAVTGHILEDDNIMSMLEGLKKKAAVIQKDMAEAEIVMEEVQKISSFYQPLAKACSSIFFCLQMLKEVNPLYQFSLAFFQQTVSAVLAQLNLCETPKDAPSDANERLRWLQTLFFRELYFRVARGLLHEHHLGFALRMLQIKLGGNEVVPEAEMEFLLAGSAIAPSHKYSQIVEHIIPSAEAKAKRDLAQLFGLSPCWSELANHMDNNIGEWKGVVNTPDAEKHIPQWLQPSGGRSTNDNEIRLAWCNLMVISILRPDRFEIVAADLIERVLGEGLMGDAELRMPLLKIVTLQCTSTVPVAFFSTKGLDASGKVHNMAVELRKQLTEIAMGSSESEIEAADALESCMRGGDWLVLKNVHLCNEWLRSIPQRIGGTGVRCHKDFRLFLTGQITSKLPTGILHVSDMFTFEPAPGVKASLLRSFNSLPATAFTASPTERKRVMVLLCWLHALVMERLRYVPLGWTANYEFSEADLACAVRVLDGWVGYVAGTMAHVSPSKLPWQAMRTLVRETIYGNRIDSDCDERVLAETMDRLFCAECFNIDFNLLPEDAADHLSLPEDCSASSVLDWIKQLPEINPPSWLGLPASADRMLRTTHYENTLRGLRLLRGVEDDELAIMEDREHLDANAAADAGSLQAKINK